MIEIRPVQVSDAKALLEIYKPYVEQTAITFEYALPSLQEFEERIRRVTEKFPYLVAEDGLDVLGYAYASTYYGRTAYNWTVEVSVYISEDARGRGIGSLLSKALEVELQDLGIKNCLTCIALPNPSSIALHEKLGYQEVGHFKEIGYKFGEWHDTIWMQKRLDEEK